MSGLKNERTRARQAGRNILISALIALGLCLFCAVAYEILSLIDEHVGLFGGLLIYVLVMGGGSLVLCLFAGIRPRWGTDRIVLPFVCALCAGLYPVFTGLLEGAFGVLMGWEGWTVLSGLSATVPAAFLRLAGYALIPSVAGLLLGLGARFIARRKAKAAVS